MCDRTAGRLQRPPGLLQPAGQCRLLRRVRRDEDQEQIDVVLAQVPDDVAKIVFLRLRGPGCSRPGTFASVRSAHLRVANAQNRELVRFRCRSSNLDKITAMIFGELYRHRTDWKFRALGQGYSTGLAGGCARLHGTL